MAHPIDRSDLMLFEGQIIALDVNPLKLSVAHVDHYFGELVETFYGRSSRYLTSTASVAPVPSTLPLSEPFPTLMQGAHLIQHPESGGSITFTSFAEQGIFTVVATLPFSLIRLRQPYADPPANVFVSFARSLAHHIPGRYFVEGRNLLEVAANERTPEWTRHDLVDPPGPWGRISAADVLSAKDGPTREQHNNMWRNDTRPAFHRFPTPLPPEERDQHFTESIPPTQTVGPEGIDATTPGAE